MSGIRGLRSASVLRFCKYLPYISGDFQAYASSCISLSVIVRFGLGTDLEPKARHPAETPPAQSRDYSTRCESFRDRAESTRRTGHNHKERLRHRDSADRQNGTF